MVLSVKMSCFFLILFFKGPQFKDKLPFSNLKCPFFCRIPLNRSKKWLWDKKMRVTHHLLGIWPRKHSQSSMHQLKTHFGVNSPLFQLKCSVLFSGIMINWLKNLLSEKKLAVTHQIMGIWPIKHLQNTEKRNFLQWWKRFTHGILRPPTSFFDRIWPNKSLLYDFFDENGVLEAFQRSYTHFLMGYTHIFSSWNIPQLIYHIAWKKNWMF